MNKMSQLYLLCFFGLQFIFIGTDCYELKPVELPSDLDSLTIFTDSDIAKFDGSDPDTPLYMGIKGVVFDVSSGGSFYAKGHSYNALVGKDATRAVAKMSLDPTDLNKDISGLGPEFLKSLDDVYSKTYLPKYPVVGYMDYLIEAEKLKRRKEDF